MPTQHLAIPATAKLDDYAVGAWMRRQRKAAGLTADQVAKLDGLDELWRLETDWNMSYRRLLAYLAAGGTRTGPANRTGLGDDPAFRPGTWLRPLRPRPPPRSAPDGRRPRPGRAAPGAAGPGPAST
ncbi:helicase associated domain-containing protein [Kitasatospora sp. NPDC004745]|uniref:helicase associated domain-containing protein n=1 Tax=Kitasatospora sp. NPDC004745 TaxID=3364019 RepID=UPI0036837046